MTRRKILLEPLRLVYKICTAEAWRTALVKGVFTGSADDLRDGYIHLSEARQAPRVLSRYFDGKKGLLIIALDVEALGDALRWEQNGDDVYPHLYAPLDISAATTTHDIPDDADARTALLDALT